MHYNLDYKITIGEYQLMFLDAVEIHKSVELLADTCTIKVPDTINNLVQKIGKRLKYDVSRGDKIKVEIGYNGDLVEEFSGYLLSINTDGGSISFNCEDSLFLLRKPVRDKQFKNVGVDVIINYLLAETGVKMKLNYTLGIKYDKFVISRATAYDVLKKLLEETHANIFITETLPIPTLNIHPPYFDKNGEVAYSFQYNIEESDLKYKTKEDRKVEIIVKTTGADGKIKQVAYGNSGGDRKTLKANGMDSKAMMSVAQNKYDSLVYDGYEGSLTGWLKPIATPTMTANIYDEEYTEKNGSYYVVSVTTTMDSSGGKRKVQIGKKLAGIEDGRSV